VERQKTSEVVSVVNSFAQTWNKHDMDAFAKLFSEDAEFVNVVGLWWRGREEIKNAHEYTHSNMFKTSILKIVETSVRLPLENFAIARSKWRLEGHTAPDGTILPPRTGILLNLFLKIDSNWMIIDSQNTDILEGELTRPQ
jgi:uncharacterized protein (TIGR02246 family)